MASKRVLIIDDEEGMRSVLGDLFQDMGYAPTIAEDGNKGLKAALDGSFELVMLDLSLPGLDGLGVLRALKEEKQDVPVVMMTGYASMRSAIDAMKLGAYDYITKPCDLNEVQMIAERAIERHRLIDENRYLKSQLKQQHGFDNVIGKNPQMQHAYVLAAQVADSNASVLILGETGTGKEYLARSVHFQSKRSEEPFIKVSCAALPETLLDSELFGHEKGSFTGAVARRIGRFEMADGGSLFLDEVGDMPHATQLKLLRVLQEKQFERVGGSETLTVDVRIIAATNRDLKKAIAEKAFREDLFYRLNVITINLPPIRERREDIPELVNHFLRKYCKETGKDIEEISSEALQMIVSTSWPGNIRELENCIERAVILCHGRRIMPQHLFLSTDSDAQPAAEVSTTWTPKSLSEVERDHIDKVLDYCNWNQTRASSILGIDRKTLRNKIRDFDLGMGIAETSPDHESEKHR